MPDQAAAVERGRMQVCASCGSPEITFRPRCRAGFLCLACGHWAEQAEIRFEDLAPVEG